MDLREKVAYLRGLADGFDLKSGSKKDRVMVEVLEVLSLFADKIERVSDECEELSSYIDSMDEDLAEMEDRIYADELDEYDDLEGFSELDDLDDDDDIDCFDCADPGCQCKALEDAVEGSSEDADD
jgi:hypothetical protein